MQALTYSHRLNLLRGLVLAATGLAALVFSFSSVQTTLEFVRTARRTDGRVVSLNAGPAHPEIEFVAPNGQKISFPAGGWISHRRGDRVGVLFLDHDPEGTAEIDEPGSRWFLAGLFAILGTALLVGGLYVIVRCRNVRGQ
jgi:Protein of unknown function (DUF3592)